MTDNIHTPKTSIGFGEFVALMAMMTAMTAMSIDAILPALSEIGLDLGVARANDNQLVISLLFLGMAVGQMFYGPVSERAVQEIIDGTRELTVPQIRALAEQCHISPSVFI